MPTIACHTFSLNTETCLLHYGKIPLHEILCDYQLCMICINGVLSQMSLSSLTGESGQLNIVQEVVLPELVRDGLSLNSYIQTLKE
jgi:hypothetical protein